MPVANRRIERGANVEHRKGVRELVEEWKIGVRELVEGVRERRARSLFTAIRDGELEHLNTAHSMGVTASHSTLAARSSLFAAAGTICATRTAGAATTAAHSVAIGHAAALAACAVAVRAAHALGAWGGAVTGFRRAVGVRARAAVPWTCGGIDRVGWAGGARESGTGSDRHQAGKGQGRQCFHVHDVNPFRLWIHIGLVVFQRRALTPTNGHERHLEKLRNTLLICLPPLIDLTQDQPPKTRGTLTPFCHIDPEMTGILSPIFPRCGPLILICHLFNDCVQTQ